MMLACLKPGLLFAAQCRLQVISPLLGSAWKGRRAAYPNIKRADSDSLSSSFGGHLPRRKSPLGPVAHTYHWAPQHLASSIWRTYFLRWSIALARTVTAPHGWSSSYFRFRSAPFSQCHFLASEISEHGSGVGSLLFNCTCVPEGDPLLLFSVFHGLVFVTRISWAIK